MPKLENLRFFTGKGTLVLIVFIALIFNSIGLTMESDDAPPLGTAWQFMLYFYGPILVCYSVGGFSGDGPTWGS